MWKTQPTTNDKQTEGKSQHFLLNILRPTFAFAFGIGIGIRDENRACYKHLKARETQLGMRMLMESKQESERQSERKRER